MPQKKRSQLGRLTYNANRLAIARINEMLEQREARLTYDRDWDAARKAKETSWERKVRPAYFRARAAAKKVISDPSNLRFLAFAYNSNLSLPWAFKIIIAKMDVLCTHCGVLKWKDKPPGLSYSNEKQNFASCDRSILISFGEDGYHFHILQSDTSTDWCCLSSVKMYM